MAKIDLDLIQQLRERTGAGMMDCKKALIETDGDIEKAIDVLRKKGAATAEKRAGNTTAEGLIHAYIHPGARIGVMVEINCETDFVARTADMVNFANDVCLHIAAMRPLFVSHESVDKAYAEKEKAFFTEQLANSGKPAAIISQIVEGKLQKMYAEVCLLNQPFVKNDKLTVADVLKELIGKLGENIKIKRFARFEIGT
jgi:elongation factor Ts